MSDGIRENDALFFELLHKHVDNAQISNLRSHDRYPFPASLPVAPLYGKGLPHVATFFDVFCRDLSQGGFSFLMLDKPVFKRLVARFGTQDEPIYVQAEVAHQREVVYFSDTGDIEPLNSRRAYEDRYGAESAILGQLRVLIGCRFIGRFTD